MNMVHTKPMKSFPEEKLQMILQAIDKALHDGATPIAAFDADGTLWDTDIGENFFDFQIKNKMVKNLPEDPWSHYLNMHETEPQKGYLWLAQINAGYEINEVRRWAKTSLHEASSPPLFQIQQRIIAHLLEKGVEVFIVTASIKWAVEPAAHLFGIPENNVIGIATSIRDGIVTTQQEGAITWREGKVQGLLERTNGQRPFFCSGNTTGDLQLLESATHLRYVNSAATPDNSNYESELELIELAKKKDWFFHRY